jgi:mRNA-degrading endonuclease RelE of RelBE toxin-antitoxin system
MYRVREGEYRIVYAVFDKEQVVFVGKIGRRSEKIYRDVAMLLATAHKVVKGK